jgi:Transcriptional regulator containing an amidase domain and an AraC-type DNA-binding HTH domain
MPDVKLYDDFLADLSVRSAQNHGAVRGAALERYRGGPNAGRKAASPQHVLTMCSGFPARFQGKSAPFVKVPGTISLVPAGVVPVWSARSDFELIVCAIDVSLVNEIHAELDRRPEGELRFRNNFEDPAAQQLMRLLFADSADGYPADRLYTDHLIHALAYRFLVIGRGSDPQSTVKQVSPLPRHILGRVIERMRNLDTELSLQVLAKESGYSRVHFVRMFRAATGYTPHNYLLKLRLDRVRELLASPTLSLTEIALECGFSSHSHLSRVFRQVLGATPSEYRRSL